MSDGSDVPVARRVALVANTDFYIGPPLALLLAERGHDLVVGDPEPGLVERLEALGAAVEVVTDVKDLADPAASEALVAAGLARFGRIDAAVAFSGRVVTGRFLDSSIDDLPGRRERVSRGAVPLPQGSGAADGGAGRRSGAHRHERIRRPSHARGAAVLVGTRRREPPRAQRRRRSRPQERPGERARHELHGLPRVPAARPAAPTPRSGPSSKRWCPCDDSGRSRSARRCRAVFLDGTSRFTTGQFLAYAGGWA